MLQIVAQSSAVIVEHAKFVANILLFLLWKQSYFYRILITSETSVVKCAPRIWRDQVLNSQRLELAAFSHALAAVASATSVHLKCMKTAWYGNVFRITDPFFIRDSTDLRHTTTTTSRHKGPVMHSRDVFVCVCFLAWTNCWSNGRVASDLTRHGAYVTPL